MTPPTATELTLAGLCVIPAGAGDSGKAPAVKEWKSFQKRRPSTSQLKGWRAEGIKTWGIVTGSISKTVVLDFDGADGRRECDELQLRPHVLTPSGGAHVYVTAPSEPVQTNTKVRPHMDVRAQGGFAVALGDGREWLRPLEWEPWEALPQELRAALVTKKGVTSATTAAGTDRIPEGERHARLLRLAGWLSQEGYTPATVESTLTALNEAACDPPQTPAEIRIMAQSTRAWAPGVRATPPKPLKDAAFHGLAGDVVRMIEPHSEADPAALLMTFLVGFGSAADHGPGFKVTATHHGVNLFAVIVGATSASRKGTSKGALRPIELADATWKPAGGLSTGEGLIHHVRDAVTKEGKDDDLIILDPGADDKRLLALESEFARPLIVMTREGNTLKPVLCDGWDGNRHLRVMTKTSPATATDAHISVLAHITTDELRIRLNSTDMASGFANRFLFVYAQRSKYLPDGGSLTDADLQPLVTRIRSALEKANRTGDIPRTEKAKQLWDRVYPQLTTPPPGMVGAVIARGAPQVARMAVIYALLDESPVVKLQHLRAALAVWRYCQQSAEYIFRDITGNPVAEKAMKLLRDAGDDGLSRTDINNAFGRHRHHSIAAALEMLEQRKMVRKDMKRTAGRSAEWWYAL